jgi:hypothetical protein
MNKLEIMQTKIKVKNADFLDALAARHCKRSVAIQAYN